MLKLNKALILIFSCWSINDAQLVDPPILFPKTAGGSQSATDNFNRTETPMAGNWTLVTSEPGTMDLNATVCIPHDTSTDSAYYYNAITPANNQFAQAKITVTGSSGGGSGLGVLVRCSTSARTYYTVVMDSAASNNIELAKMVAGTYTTLSGWPRTITYVAGATLKLSITGTTITVTYNGAAVGADTTDSSIASGRWGVRFSSSDSGPSMDDFAGGEN